MNTIEDMTSEELTRVLTYSGFILIAFELVKSLIVKPIKYFYMNTTFGDNIMFNSYEIDVMSRDRNEFKACLLYLRDFMEAIDSEDLLIIQELREQRNTLAHDLVSELKHLNVKNYIPLLEKVDKVLSKLSNYRTRMEIEADPEFKNKIINWDIVVGHEYVLFEEILEKIKILLIKGENV